MMNALAPQATTQLQIGQMPMVGQTPSYQMHGGQFGSPDGAPGAVSGGGFHNALMDWRQQRPDRPFDMSAMQDWRSQLQDWRQQRPTRGGFMGGPVMTPGGGTTGGPLPGMPAPSYPVPPMQTVPQAQYPMVGSQLGVMGMTPAANGYGLPGY